MSFLAHTECGLSETTGDDRIKIQSIIITHLLHLIVHTQQSLNNGSDTTSHVIAENTQVLNVFFPAFPLFLVVFYLHCQSINPNTLSSPQLRLTLHTSPYINVLLVIWLSEASVLEDSAGSVHGNNVP